MASSLVQSVSMSILNERQTVCWSQDHRLAVCAENEIFIMKLEVFCGKGIFTGSEVIAKVIFSLDDLSTRSDPWPDLRLDLQRASKDVRREVRQRWTFSSLGSDQLTSRWTALLWSPPGLAPNDRTVLAGLTSDHRLIITGISATSRQWVQLADLGEQLMEQELRLQPQPQRPPKRTAEVEGHYEDVAVEARRFNVVVRSVYASMCRMAPIDAAWSHVLEAGGERCVLLFVVMKNADIVTWNIALPCNGIESCRVVDRQAGKEEEEVCSLAWTSLPAQDSGDTGLLAVGYKDGRVSVLCYSVQSSSSPHTCPHVFTHLLQPDADYLSVYALAWFAAGQQNTLILLYGKGQTTCAQVISLDHHGNHGGGEGKEGGGRVVEGPCCQVALGNVLAAVGIAVSGDVVMMASGDRVHQLAVSQSPTEVGVRRVREVPLHRDPDNMWGCVSMAPSQNAALVATLCRPYFPFNHLHPEFREPMKVHISPLATDWDTLGSLLSSPTVSPVTAIHDILELSCHVLHTLPVTKETVAMVTERLSSPPYSQPGVGQRVARHLLSILKLVCQQKELTDEVQSVTSAQQQVTERLLCAQVSQVCRALHKTRPSHSNPADVSLLNTMLNWVTWSEWRSEVVGSEVIDQLRSALGQPQPDVCLLCDGDVDMSDAITVTCPNSHTFGLCCHSLAVCNRMTYQCCMTCGMLALSAKALKGVPWETEGIDRCRLCQSVLYSTTSSLRF